VGATRAICGECVTEFRSESRIGRLPMSGF
jgi:hypothetical protein